MIEFRLLQGYIAGTELCIQSTWSNHTSGSAGQKGGILMFTAVTAGIEDDGCSYCCGGSC